MAWKETTAMLCINGRQYRFKRGTLGLLRDAAAMTRSASVFTDNWFDALKNPDAFARMADEWRSYCALIIENPDEGLDLDRLTPEEAASVPGLFFAHAAGTGEPMPPSGLSAGSPASAETTISRGDTKPTI